MEDVVAVFQEYASSALSALTGACASLEPRSSVWILAAFGAAFSAFRGRQHGVLSGVARWIGGTFFSVAFTVGIDHFDPMAESFLVGFVSAEITKVFVENAGSWFGGILSSKVAGGRNVS